MKLSHTTSKIKRHRNKRKAHLSLLEMKMKLNHAWVQNHFFEYNAVLLRFNFKPGSLIVAPSEGCRREVCRPRLENFMLHIFKKMR